MSLRAIDITKVKKLSLMGVNLPPSKRREELILVERPPTDEEIAYSKLVGINPLIEELVVSLDLVSIKTGERIKKHTQDHNNLIDLTQTKLLALAQRVIDRENSYNKEDIITKIKEATNVNQEKAERDFRLILKFGIIEQINNSELYYLTGSTPF